VDLLRTLPKKTDLLVSDALKGITQAHQMNPLQLLESRAKLLVRQIKFRTPAGENYSVGAVL
jgi:hypothetical protein